MIDRNYPQASVRRQCRLLSLNRPGVYYGPRPRSDLNERLMRRLDELYTAHPFLGYRKLTKLLQTEGHAVNGKRVLRLLRRLGLHAIYPKRDTSKPHPMHPVYPYLLRNLAITGPGQVWATDITYIRLRKGFCYLAAVIDWYSRYVVSWRLSPALESPFCIETLQAALAQGTPGIFNSGQGSQFTSGAFTDVLIEAGVRISMDGKGSYHDNIFTGRLWRPVKYEDVYLKDYCDTGFSPASASSTTLSFSSFPCCFRIPAMFGPFPFSFSDPIAWSSFCGAAQTYSFPIDGTNRKVTEACATHLALLQRMVAQFEADHP